MFLTPQVGRNPYGYLRIRGSPASVDRIPLYVRACSLSLCQLSTTLVRPPVPLSILFVRFVPHPPCDSGILLCLDLKMREEPRFDSTGEMEEGSSLKVSPGGTPCAFSVPSIVTVRYLPAIAATTIGRVPNPLCPRLAGEPRPVTRDDVEENRALSSGTLRRVQE